MQTGSLTKLDLHVLIIIFEESLRLIKSLMNKTGVYLTRRSCIRHWRPERSGAWSRSRNSWWPPRWPVAPLWQRFLSSRGWYPECPWPQTSLGYPVSLATSRGSSFFSLHHLWINPAVSQSPVKEKKMKITLLWYMT